MTDEKTQAPEAAGWAAPRSRPTVLTETALAAWDKATTAVRDFAERHGLSKAEVSRRAGIPQGTFSPWYDGTYQGATANITSKVEKWLAAEADKQSTAAAQIAEPGFVMTRTASDVLAALTYAQTAPAMTIITLGAGMGKSTICRHYSEQRPHAIRVCMRPSTAAVVTVMKTVGEAVGVTERDPAKIADAIGQKMRRNGRHTLLMIDEAQNLSDKAVNELRYLLDEYGCGIALIGNEEVSTKWGGASPKDGQAQIHRRIGHRIRRMQPLAEDIEVFVEAWNLPDADMKRLARAICRKPGALGQMVESLKLASMIAAGAGRPMTAADLKAGWANRSGEEMH